MTEASRALALVLALTAPFPTAANEPLAASDWLSGSLRNPPRESSAWRPGAARPPGVGAIAPVARKGTVGQVSVRRLDGADIDAAGTHSARAAALPADLWAGSDLTAMTDLIAKTPARLPAMTALMRRLLTAQLTPPDHRQDQQGLLFLARTDRLLTMGDLASARALLAAAGPSGPEAFRRLFDVALLEGDEARACDAMNRAPGIAPSFAARIFCLAQSGDWAAAALVFHGAQSQGALPPDRADLLQQFLDDSYVDAGQNLTSPATVTPLDFRLFEAIGQPLPTAPLPLAFAHSDLRDNSGWKARIEAAERLARAGVIAPARLLAAYTEQRPAASGGVWDRAAAMQALDAALNAGDPGRSDAALIAAYDGFDAAGMLPALAGMLAPRLPGMHGDPQADQAARRASHLRQWLGLLAPPGLTEATPPDRIGPADPASAPETRKGEALLAAMADIDAGLEGDLHRAGRGLAMLQALGLDRDAALARAQLNLMDTR